MGGIWGTERRDREAREGGVVRMISGEEDIGGRGKDWAGCKGRRMIGSVVMAGG